MNLPAEVWQGLYLLPEGEGTRAADKPSHMALYHTINVVTDLSRCVWPETLDDVCVLYLPDTESRLRLHGVAETACKRHSSGRSFPGGRETH